MASYNWDHQEVILRVVASLQDRGYAVWVDVEQMKGATVDTMALAVEASEVVLIGVSRAYKESSNCRMEAQYAFQKKKPIIPLKLTQGYEADGWLGLLLGTSMWYALYGDTLSSTSAFESRMDGVCREIGGRGRADALVTEAAASTSSTPRSLVPAMRTAKRTPSALLGELQGLRLKALFQRAKEAGVDDDTLEDATDSDDPKDAVIAILLSRLEVAVVASPTSADLHGMRLKELRQRARELGVGEQKLEDSLGAEDPKAAVIALVVEASFAPRTAA
jgi:hypothetical protein